MNETMIALVCAITVPPVAMLTIDLLINIILMCVTNKFQWTFWVYQMLTYKGPTYAEFENYRKEEQELRLNK